MYRCKKRRRSGDGGRVQDLAVGGLALSADAEQEWQQQQQQQATSLIPLNRIISNTLLANNNADVGINMVRNPYYMFTDPTYCLTSIGGIERDRLEFDRQVHHDAILLNLIHKLR